MALRRPAVELDLALPDFVGESPADGPNAESVMGDRIIVLLDENAARIRNMTAGMQRGDEAAFREFYECYCDRLFRYLLLLTRGNEDLSRELLQATMTKVVRSSRLFNEEGSLWNWIATIARNSFIDALRRMQRAPQFLPLLPGEASEMPMLPPDAAETALSDALDFCLEALSTGDRALIEAIYFEGVSHQTVAEQQSTSPKAVESKLARLRQKLRAAILKRLRYEND